MLGKYFHTIKYLKSEQLLGQVRLRLSKRRQKLPEFHQKYAAGASLKKAAHTESKIRPPVPESQYSDLSSGQFHFVGETHTLTHEKDWSFPSATKLWRYNLHYFDWMWHRLNQENDWTDFIEQFRSWQDWSFSHPHSEAWDPYPVSLRLMNWSLLCAVRHRDRFIRHRQFSFEMSSLIRSHAIWLSRNLETHIQANHLLENLVAVYLSTGLFSWDGSEDLHLKFEKRLLAELKEQILDDGMHYERSPMYHSRVLWLVEMVSNVAEGETKQLTLKMLRKMRKAYALICHPDGEIARIQDSMPGIYSAPEGIEGSVSGGWCLKDAGYYGWRSENDYLIIDAGSVSPSHQPGHAHAGLFSYELSIQGIKMVSDTGVSSYADSLVRNHERSTAAHSNGRN